MKATIDTRRASVEQELARLDAEQRAIEQAELETASLMEYCARVRAELQTFTLDEKRRALDALNVTVVWHPGKPPEIHGSIPMHIPCIWCLVRCGAGRALEKARCEPASTTRSHRRHAAL